MNPLIKNIDKVHTTPMGVNRIRINLGLGDQDAVLYCKNRILDPEATIERSGKNWYVFCRDCQITVNAYTYTIITAHKRAYA